MTKFLPSLFLLFSIVFFSCNSSDDDFTDGGGKVAVILGDFEITVDAITMTTATVNWTEAAASDKSKVTYDVLINDKLIAEGIVENTYALDNLTLNTEYELKIVARGADDAFVDRIFFFTTIGTAPSLFPLSYTDNGCTVAFIDWEAPTVEDGSSYSYETFVNGIFVRGYSQSNVGLNFLVNEGELNTVKIVAKTFNGAETSEEITFFKEVCPTPSAFDISVSNITSSTARLDWTAATMEDGSAVRYFIKVNGIGYPAGNVSLGETFLNLQSLERDTMYDIVITAESVDNSKTSEATLSFTTTNEYPVHPTFTVTEAILYTKNSSALAKQLRITFSEPIGDKVIIGIVSGEIEIGNFTMNSNSILTNAFSDTEYDQIRAAGDGYVLVEIEGTFYQLDFAISDSTL
ncbi:fibronectin type III domain-containing protein [Aquimarina sp. 2-A2]|uniref:fibronectin type III domain-containing protein n=1 Tax=Aquimarina sp. 2-A2 TaxID=3382644 RepID=UPI00387F31A4